MAASEFDWLCPSSRKNDGMPLTCNNYFHFQCLQKIYTWSGARSGCSSVL